MKLNRIILFTIVKLLFLSQVTHAGLFNIDISSYGVLNQTAVDAAVLELETEVNANLPNSSQGEFFEAMANASVMAGKDLHSDPINNIDYAMVILGVGAGVDLNNRTFDDIEDENGDVDVNNIPGVGAQLGLTLGVHGQFLPKKYFRGERWSLFVNYFQYAYDKDDAEIKLRTAGLHMRYKMWQGYDLIRWKMMRLEPVFLTFGYEFNQLKGNFSEAIQEEQTESGVTGLFTGTGVIDLDVLTHSMPLSISSGMTFLYLVTVYGGIGADLNFGKASGSGQLTNTTLTLTEVSSGNTATGTASLNLGDKNGPKNFFSRGFVGAQLNIWNFKIFAQAQKTFGRNLYGAQAGFKYFF